MYRKLGMTAKDWLHLAGRLREAAKSPASPRHFSLLRWFSIVSFLAVLAFSLAFALVLSHFMKQEILQRDAIQTSQFVSSLAESQLHYAGLDAGVTMGMILDPRTNLAGRGIHPPAAEDARLQFYDHISVLPDALLANIYAPDRHIVWSTNPALIGKHDPHNDELEKALETQIAISTEYDAAHEREKDEQHFHQEPRKFFVEIYVPLIGPSGRVDAVVEVYKEPASLEQTIIRGQKLVWTSVALGAAFLYLALFWIIRRADRMVTEQERRLVESEALCVIGEMSAAVAHGIRNPLASIRSSAELALDGDPEATRKNATDIIAQVDRLGQWIRDLLVYSRPVSGELQTIALDTLVGDCLHNFSAQLEQGRIQFEFVRPAEPMPKVVGNWSLATQALASVIANAIEAMPEGGALRLELAADLAHRRVDLMVSDSGPGMTPAQVEQVFKPFYTTKRKGLGLGMALVKRIMERVGGTVALHSRPGEGTRLTLSFRVA